MTSFRTLRHAPALALLPALLAGCATPIKPETLAVPKQLSCIQLPQALEAHDVRGLLNIHWTTRLSPGPYISEREGPEGTYYRAPPAGIYIGRDEVADKPPTPLLPRTFNGGILVPREAGKQVQLYTYFSTEEAPTAQLPPNASCASAVSIPDPQAKGVSSVAFATGGAIGGAAGGVAARATTTGSSMSYGQAAGAGAAGGLVGGVIIAGFINMDVGKIVPVAPSSDARFLAELNDLGKRSVLLPVQTNGTGSRDRAQ